MPDSRAVSGEPRWTLNGLVTYGKYGGLETHVTGPDLEPGAEVPVVDEAWCREDQTRKIVAFLQEIHPESGGWDAAQEVESEFGGSRG